MDGILGVEIGLTVALAVMGWMVVVALVLGRRRVLKVDQYAISLEEHDGFRFVHVKFQDARGKYSTFEFAPPFGHALSDELCTASARAMKAPAHASG